MNAFFTNKSISKSTLTIIKNDKIISEDKQEGEIPNNRFEVSAPSSEIDILKPYTKDCNDIEDIVKFSKHPGILKIDDVVDKQKFPFLIAPLTRIEHELGCLILT